MSYTLGIDVGTTYTAAAICRRGVDAFDAGEVVGLGSRSSVTASVVFIGDDGQWLIGDPAERRAQDRPELVVREFKRRIGDPVPMVVGETRLLPEVLAARVARWVVDRVTDQEATAPDAIVVTYPASWGVYKRSLLRAALDDTGLDNASLVVEPVAAAAHYAAHARVAVGTAVAVYDLGGGTFDAAVVRKVDDCSFALLGTPQGLESVGGLDFDQAVFRYVNQAVSLPPVDPADVDGLVAMLGLRRECTEAKEALSADTEATISVLLPDLRNRVRLVRGDFESLIHDAIVQTADTLASTVVASGIDVAELDAVLLVGGSSRIPLISQVVGARFDCPIVVDADPKTAVALGAAMIAAVGLGGAAAPQADAGSARRPQVAAVSDIAAAPPRRSRRRSRRRARRGAGRARRGAGRAGPILVFAVAASIVGGTTMASFAVLDSGDASTIAGWETLKETVSPVAPKTPGETVAPVVAGGAVGSGTFWREMVITSFPLLGAETAPTSTETGSATPDNTSTSVAASADASSSTRKALRASSPIAASTTVASTAPVAAGTLALATNPPPPTVSDSTEAPITSPPATSPPVATEPPLTTAPIVTEPPVTTAPTATEPPVTTAPTATEPPVNNPPPEDVNPPNEATPAPPAEEPLAEAAQSPLPPGEAS